jgi:hypothetical protein
MFSGNPDYGPPFAEAMLAEAFRADHVQMLGTGSRFEDERNSQRRDPQA